MLAGLVFSATTSQAREKSASSYPSSIPTLPQAQNMTVLKLVFGLAMVACQVMAETPSASEVSLAQLMGGADFSPIQVRQEGTCSPGSVRCNSGCMPIGSVCCT